VTKQNYFLRVQKHFLISLHCTTKAPHNKLY